MGEDRWRVRATNEEFDIHNAYDEYPTRFTLEVHHGGCFTDYPGIKYIKGNVTSIDMVDSYVVSSHMFGEIMEEIGYSKKVGMRRHYKIPYVHLDLGLRPLETELEFKELVKHGLMHKIVEVYVEMLSLLNVEDVNQSLEDDDEDEDSDYIVDDEDNSLTDVQVDMDEFRHAIDFEEDELSDEEDEQLPEEVDSDEFDSASDSDDATPLEMALHMVRRKNKGLKVNSDDDCPFKVGQVFGSRHAIKDMVIRHAIETRRQLNVCKNDKVRFRVVCFGSNLTLGSCERKENQIVVGGKHVGTSKNTNKKVGSSSKEKKKAEKKEPTCPWVLHISLVKKTGSFTVKTIESKHTCLQTREVNLCTISWIAKEIEPTLRVNPDIPLRSIQEMLQQKFQIQITPNQIFKAKMKATQKIEGDFKGQYASLRDYCDELIRCNPGSTCKIDIEPEANPSNPTRQFRRIYICLQGLKEGWKLSGREIIGLDGCFMKGPYPGQILTAVGVDANNGIYPVAYGIVESECAASWSWFLGYLGDDLGLSTRSNFTFISDRQKGIIPALARMFPNAEHRYCVRHIHENMKLRWRGPAFRDLIWKCARAATPQEFDVAMKEVYKENKDAHAWLKEIPPRHWSRSHFSGRSKSDLLINNLCEVFNKQLVGGRDKPIITCLEYIREYLMKRLVIVKKIIAKADGPLTPTIAKRFEFTKKAASNYRVFWNSETKYQVQSIGANEDQCIVQLDKKTCSCKKWELTGIPCRHAVACIWDQRDHGLDDGVAEKWVDEAYWVETWKKVYAHTVDPINGKRLWKPNECPTTLIPPKHHIQVGRPTKKRKKAADEVSQSKKAVAEELSQTIGTTGKLPRRGNSVTCQICKQKGHNKRTCSQRIHVNQVDGVQSEDTR